MFERMLHKGGEVKLSNKELLKVNYVPTWSANTPLMLSRISWIKGTY